MQAVIVKLIPIFLFFGLGILLKRIRFAVVDKADFLLKFVFFVTLPALVLLNLSRTPMTRDEISLPFIFITIDLFCMLFTLFLSRFLSLDKKTLGSMLLGTMMVNSVFMFPFIIAGFGDAGFTVAALLDFGNALVTATASYLTAVKFGDSNANSNTMVSKLLKSPFFGRLVWQFFSVSILFIFPCQS